MHVQPRDLLAANVHFDTQKTQPPAERRIRVRRRRTSVSLYFIFSYSLTHIYIRLLQAHANTTSKRATQTFSRVHECILIRLFFPRPFCPPFPEISLCTGDPYIYIYIQFYYLSYCILSFIYSVRNCVLSMVLSIFFLRSLRSSRIGLAKGSTFISKSKLPQNCRVT